MWELPDILLRTVVIMAVIIGLTRMNGLRSFSKMSGFDFATTVAIGSVLAGTITAPDTSLWFGIGGIASLFLFQALVARLRTRLSSVRSTLDNQPVVVMRDGEVLADNLKAAEMTEEDLMAKLREANALQLSNVHAVVVESTGDVSVLHGDAPGGLSPRLLEGVRS